MGALKSHLPICLIKYEIPNWMNGFGEGGFTT